MSGIRVRWARLLFTLPMLLALLSACDGATPAPPPPAARTRASLPDIVEEYMANLDGPSPKLFLTSRVYDRNGVLLAEYWDEGRRYWVPLASVAPPVIQATIATEDKNFYTNPGVDWSAIARAVMVNATEGEVASGASTITQQLARNISMPYEKRLEQSIDRKLTETALAQELTERFTKDELLEMYLNVVYYGRMAYGVEAASRTFFGKPATQLNLAESAMLAGLPQSPAVLDPLVPENLDRAKSRQGVVLALMAKNGFISQELAQATYAEPLNFQPGVRTPHLAPHFLNYLQQSVETSYGKGALGRGGFTITATIDSRIQTMAEETVKKQVDSVRVKYNMTSVALVALKPGTGEIIAMVGSADFYDSKISGQVNVTTSLRQPGSSIKPILYAAAFSRGYTPGDIVFDTGVSFTLPYGQIYRPVNYDGKYHGAVRLRQALANSFNIPAVKLLSWVGVPNMVDLARAMGIQGLDQPADRYGLALTLGGSEVTLLSLTNAYATLGSGGRMVEPTPILAIADSMGRTISRLKPAPTQVLDERVAYQVTSILSDNDARTPMFGANSPLKLSRPVAGKTGTTNDWRDNLTMGYTPYLSVGVWAGNADGSLMRNTTGLTGAAPIWHDFFEAVFSDPSFDASVRRPNEPIEFIRPPGLLDVPICTLSQLKLGAECPSTKTDVILDPRIPVRVGNGGTTASPVPSAPIAEKLDPALTRVSVARVGGNQLCTSAEFGEPTVMLRLPGDQREADQARSWAAGMGLRPQAPACTESQLAQVKKSTPTPVATTAAATGVRSAITSPKAGATVSGEVEIKGTAQFDAGVYDFYKVEYGNGREPAEWITMGSGHKEPVTNGRLEMWHAGTLPAGTYSLRVVVVKKDGNFVTSPPVVITIRR